MMEITLKIDEISQRHVGKAIAIVDPKVVEENNLQSGDILEIIANRKSHVKLWPGSTGDYGTGIIRIDGSTRHNIGASIGEKVSVKKVEASEADEIVVSPTEKLAIEGLDEYMLTNYEGHVFTTGDTITVNTLGGKIQLIVTSTKPSKAVIVTTKTRFKLGSMTKAVENSIPRFTYDDLGGLKKEIQKVREMIELPMRHPELFEKIGVEAPKGVLLYGPPGTGKTLIAKAVAGETNAHFTTISGPEIISKYYGESEERLREIFKQAEENVPSIIFIDEIDSIAPKRPDSIDPALRRPGRFDREIEIGIPDDEGRYEILNIHTRGMPLDDKVDLQQISKVTHGFVGADLEMLAKESAIREVLVQIPNVTWDDIGGLESLKEELREAIEWPLKHKEAFDHLDVTSPKGVLLYGPPGTGKTLITKAVAKMTESNFISIKGPELLSKWVGESEKGIREIFRKARQAAPCIIFFDELDSIVPRRGSSSDSHVTENVVSQILTEIDGLEELHNVLIIGATNRLDIIDPALLRPGRFDRIIEVPQPDAKSREHIFRIHTKKKPLADDVNFTKLIELTEGFTGADIAEACNRAALISLKRYVGGKTQSIKDVRITQADLVEATQKIKPTTRTLEAITQYQ